MYYFRVVRNPVLEVMLLDNNEPTSYGEVMVGLDSKMARGHIIRERIHMKTKCRLWKNYLMVVRLLGTYGFLKGRWTMMVSITIKKARLVVKMFFPTSSRS